MKLQLVPFVSTFLGVALALPGQTPPTYKATYAEGAEATPSSLSANVFGTAGAPLLPPDLSSGWSTEHDPVHDFAVFRNQAPLLADSVTLLFAHMMPDPSQLEMASDRRALEVGYPFLGLPNGTWTLADDSFQIKDWDFKNSKTQQVVIPPERMSAHIEGYLASRASISPIQYGPTTVHPLNLYAHPAEAVSSVDWDERYYLNSSWHFDRTVVDLASLSPRSLRVGAFFYYHQTNSGSLARLNQLIEADHRWLLQIQAVQVEINPSTRPRIKLSNPVKIRRMTSGGYDDSLWRDAVGASRILPSLYSDDQVSFGAKGHFTEVEFEDLPAEPVQLYCHFPVAGGGFVSVQRVTHMLPSNFPCITARPHIGVFSVPGNAVPGVICVTGPNFVPIPVRYAAPGSNGCGAWFWAFEANPQ
ncbi:MAG: hypothetical protein MUC36_11500 [Planctomycetes bacterium]|jgi:hypothetical protein|nr:hypothetical protein [Planctomycetota bacterium]